MLVVKELLDHQVLVSTDNAFQRKVRLRQAIWREKNGYRIGLRRLGGAEKLGSRLEMPWAREKLLNFLTQPIRDLVEEEVFNPATKADRLFNELRLVSDLLSSQPMCFNLFGELKLDLELATEVFKLLSPGKIAKVTGIEFEYSPGRRDLRYTGDRSAFDVFVKYKPTKGRKGFLGIEVKYHENLRGSRKRPKTKEEAEHARVCQDRYDELAQQMTEQFGVFKRPLPGELHKAPLEQMLRDHLLAGSMLVKDAPDGGRYDEGAFVFLYPEGNICCSKAVANYQRYIQCGDTFAAWKLEEVVAALEAAGPGEEWIELFRERYLG